MLRCRILVFHAWNSGKYHLRCSGTKAGFSSLPPVQALPSHESRVHDQDTRSALSPQILNEVGSPHNILGDPLREPVVPLITANDVVAIHTRAETQSEKPGAAGDTSEAINDVTKEKDQKVSGFTISTAKYLLEKLEKLRSASRNISAVATAAIDSSRDPLVQTSSPTASDLQAGVAGSQDKKVDAKTSLVNSLETSQPANPKDEKHRKAPRANLVASRSQADPEKPDAEVLELSSKKTSASSRRKNLATSAIRKRKRTASLATKTKSTSIRRAQLDSHPIIKSALLSARNIKMEALDASEQPPVKTLSYDLDRVLFKQGVYNLQDPRTGVFNFDHYLQNIMPADEFDFDSLARFMTSSQDATLQSMAKKHGKRYVGSTSSMTSVLSHFHFLLSSFRPLNLSRISRAYPDPLTTFTEFTRIPTSIYLKYKDGVYAIDSDKEFDRATILSRLGQSLEKLLTVPKDFYEQYRKSSTEKISEEVKNAPEAYHYSSLGNFVFRSQLDGRHDWLPGSGIFDIKTRACVTIRMDQDNYKEMSGYQIKNLYGEWESYEREYLDMLRSTMLKYSLQVRMGRMDGIFVAYHNTEQIFGFQYIPLSEMDLALHGQEDLALGDHEFKLSVQMFSDVFDMVTERFPEQSIRFHFETRPRSSGQPRMYIFAEPMDTETMDTVQQAETEIAMQELRNEMLGKETYSETSAAEDAANDEFEELEEHEYSTEMDLPESVEVSAARTSVATETGQAEGELNTEQAESEFETLLPKHAASEHPAQTEGAIATDEEASASDSIDANHLEQPDSSFTQITNGVSLAEALSAKSQASQTGSNISKAKMDNQEIKRPPLLGLKLTVSHIINGKEVKKISNIKYSGEWPVQQAQYQAAKFAGAPGLNKSWDVSYRITQFTEASVHKMYAACQARKRRKFEKLNNTDAYRERYISMMRRLSERGRHRKKRDEKMFGGIDMKEIVD